MALRKNNIKEEVKLKNIRTKRISSHFLTNNYKKSLLTQHFNEVCSIKNNISEYLFSKLPCFLSEEQRNSLRKQYKIFKNESLSAWELQQIFQEFFDKYDNVIKRYKKNHKFVLHKKINITYYKKDTKYHKKGDVKSRKIIYKHTRLSRMINWLMYLPFESLDQVLKAYPKEDKSTPEKVAKVKTFNDDLNTIREKPYWKKIKTLIQKKQQRLVKKIRLITTQSGAYRKAVKENPNVASVNSEIITAHNNKQFKYFYKFKIARKEVLYIPLSYNKDFHNHFKDINLNANHYVSLNNKGQLTIGLQEKYQQTFESTLCKEQIVGIDLNIKHNFCVIEQNKEYTNIDYDRNFFKKQIQDLKDIDALGYNNLTDENKRKLQKIVGRTESYFQRLISEILDGLQLSNVTEIVLEDLNLQKTSGNTFNQEFGVSYSRLVKILRLNQIKHWFKNQANKRHMKVHFTSPCATSQECSQCHHIAKENRQTQEKFKCVKCGHEANADNQASFTIGERIREDVLCESLHILEKDGQYVLRKLTRELIKKTIGNYYNKQSRLNRDPPITLDCDRETNSKCEA